MPVKTIYKSGADLPPEMQKEFDVKPHQFLKVTIEDVTDEYDTANVGDDLVEAFKEIAEAKKRGRELPNARDLLNSL